MKPLLKFILPIIFLFGLVIPMNSCKTGNSGKVKKIVILAGPKSHPATLHEYIKSARLIKLMLDRSANLKNVSTSLCLNGWPENEVMLDSADLILTLSDGRDGPNGLDVPYFTDQRMDVIEKQVKRGCGLMNIHYSTFAPDKYGDRMLEWVGGYFDWQNDKGEREWYSDIRFMEVPIDLLNKSHPVFNGVKPFRVLEEYYFKLRFREKDDRLVPLINVPGLGTERENGGVVAWAINRKDGGRGFGTTLGHFYSNWKNDNYRKFLLNAIAWTAGVEIPVEGIQSDFYPEPELSRLLNNKIYKALILTGNDHPLHKWKETSPVVKKALESNGQVMADVSVNIHDLTQYDLRDYDLLVFNYCNWEDPNPLWDSDKQALVDYVNHGGGLMFIHFAGGAFHFSLPGAGASEWPEYRKFCRRVWNHKGSSSHDAHGEFLVNIVDSTHMITNNIKGFGINDELYYNQEGDEDIHVLLSAKSKNTGKEEPLAWVYEIPGPSGKTSRVFQTVLGHDTGALSVAELQKLLNNAAIWASEGTQYWNDL